MIVTETNRGTYEKIYGSGYNKSYPNIDLVRLEKWFFKGGTGKLLEYGFGVGENLLHLVRCGHTVTGMDISKTAQGIVQKKLDTQGLQAELLVLAENAQGLPFEDNTFDYISCVNVLSLLGTKANVKSLLSEFKRVLKPSGKMIIDINALDSDYAHFGKEQEENSFVYRGQSGEDDPEVVYCCTQEDFGALLKEYFTLVDMGEVVFDYFKNKSHEYIACVENNK